MKSKGLEKLGFVPDRDFKLQDDGEGSYIKDWFSTEPRPTQAAVDAAYIEWENDYSRNRKEEYPSVDELIVALWEGVVEERMAAVTKLEAKRQAVKLKYPK
tara:strand:- start:177 stop:479 length:303 start_codon:yes stop_codon:yes gene_type:complete